MLTLLTVSQNRCPMLTLCCEAMSEEVQMHHPSMENWLRNSQSICEVGMKVH